MPPKGVGRINIVSRWSDVVESAPKLARQDRRERGEQRGTAITAARPAGRANTGRGAPHARILPMYKRRLRPPRHSDDSGSGDVRGGGTGMMFSREQDGAGPDILRIAMRLARGFRGDGRRGRAAPASRQQIAPWAGTDDDSATEAPFVPSARACGQTAFDAGLICCPRRGTDDGQRGDQVFLAPLCALIAPPVSEPADTFGKALEAVPPGWAIRLPICTAF